MQDIKEQAQHSHVWKSPPYNRRRQLHEKSTVETVQETIDDDASIGRLRQNNEKSFRKSRRKLGIHEKVHDVLKLGRPEVHDRYKL